MNFLDLWCAEFHVTKEPRAKLVGLPGSAVWLKHREKHAVKNAGLTTLLRLENPAFRKVCGMLSLFFGDPMHCNSLRTQEILMNSLETYKGQRKMTPHQCEERGFLEGGWA